MERVALIFAVTICFLALFYLANEDETRMNKLAIACVAAGGEWSGWGRVLARPAPSPQEPRDE